MKIMKMIGNAGYPLSAPLGAAVRERRLDTPPATHPGHSRVPTWEANPVFGIAVDVVRKPGDAVQACVPSSRRRARYLT